MSWLIGVNWNTTVGKKTLGNTLGIYLKIQKETLTILEYKLGKYWDGPEEMHWHQGTLNKNHSYDRKHSKELGQKHWEYTGKYWSIYWNIQYTEKILGWHTGIYSKHLQHWEYTQECILGKHWNTPGGNRSKNSSWNNIHRNIYIHTGKSLGKHLKHIQKNTGKILETTFKTFFFF